MTKKRQNNIEKIIRNSGAAEHVINIFKGAASFHPAAGVLASLISDYIPKQREIKLEEFANAIAHELERFKGEINDDYIKTDEFAFIFEKCFKGAMENYQVEKIQAFKGILINSMKKNSLNQNEKEFFLSLIDRLSITHIQILWFMAQPQKYLEERSLPMTNVQGGFSQFFPRVIHGVSLDYIKLAFHDLYNYGFINTDKSIFGTMTSSSGFDLLGNRVTKTGEAFINFVSLY